MLVSIGHVTRYSFAAPALYSIHTLRLTPPALEGQRVISWRVEMPDIEHALRYRDAFGNVSHLVTIARPHSEVTIIARGTVATHDKAGFVRGLAEVAPTRVFRRETAKTAPDDAIRELTAGLAAPDPIDRLHELMQLVGDRVEYRVGATNAHTSAAEALKAGRGVCQDHAHVFISAARLLGFPARYVNGYFVTGGEHASEAQHAWAGAYIDGLGWLGFDPANQVCPTDRYARLACGLDAASAAPITGNRRGAPTRFLTSSLKSSSKAAPSSSDPGIGVRRATWRSLGTLPMTYCVALRLNRGLVFAADTRTNAGVDNIAQFRKIHYWRKPGERVLVLLAAGNLSLTQSVVSLLNEQLVEREEEPEAVNLFNVPSMYRAARLVGDAVRSIRAIDGPALEATKTGFAGSFILGGQIGKEPPRLFQVYSEGNFIEATDDTPYFQIGEHKYGKPILDRVAQPTMRLGEAAKLVLLSFDSTLRSNLSVGMPIDILLYERDSLELRREKRIFQDDEYFKKLSSAWSEALRSAFTKIEEFNL